MGSGYYFEYRLKSELRMEREACESEKQAFQLANKAWDTTPHENWSLFRVVHYRLGSRTILKDYLKEE